MSTSLRQFSSDAPSGTGGTGLPSGHDYKVGFFDLCTGVSSGKLDLKDLLRSTGLLEIRSRLDNGRARTTVREPFFIHSSFLSSSTPLHLH